MASSSIQRLPTYVANQIAAGEVIERPASIVKELIENSLDAAATQLEIRIIEGGLESIQVRDNGSGIRKEELVLALERHATSKIYQAQDIENITTLGFRGEALASMSAIARVKLTSRFKEAQHGWEMITEPGHSPTTPKPVSHPIGTCLEISDIFHNTPARRRFLRTPSTEFSRIQTLVKCLSLNYFNVGFTLYHNQRQLFQLTPYDDPTARAQRIALVCGSTFAETAIYLDQKAAHLHLSGWISDPTFSRSQADLHYFYVNGRFIKDKVMSHAVKQAYQDVLYNGRQPAVVLFLAIDPHEVDVNVHPSKAEVRFRRSELIYDFVKKSIQNTLSKSKLYTATQPAQTPTTYSTAASSDPMTTIANHVHENWRWEPKKAQLITQPAITIPTTPSREIEKPSSSEALALHTPLNTPNNIQHTLEESHSPSPFGYALAQLHNTYVLAQNEKGLIIIDAHAAHERVLYEQLKKELSQNALHRQLLLVPIELSLSAEEIEIVNNYASLFKRIGFQYEQITSERITLTSVPDLLNHLAVATLFQDVLTDLKTQGKSYRLEEKTNHLLATLACRSAIHTNRVLTLPEMNQLLQLMATTQHIDQCNHGRPTWREITLKELDSWFLRGR